MRSPFLILLLALLGGALALGYPLSRRPAPFDDGRPYIHADRSGGRVKPRAAIGAIEASIVARPAAGRARIEARWRLRAGAEDATVEIVLPEGAWLVEGRCPVALPVAPGAGDLGWLVGHEDAGRSLDLVLRLRARGVRGVQTLETYVRLVDAR